MGILKRLFGKAEHHLSPANQRQHAALAKAVEARRSSGQPPVVMITQKLREWDVPDETGADIWWRGFDLHDENGRGWTWDDPTLAGVGIVITKVTGVQYHEGLLHENVRPGRVFRLVPEPHNQQDANAVAVWDEAEVEQIGYIPREVAVSVAHRLAKGEELHAMCIAELVEKPGDARVGIRVLLAPPGTVEGLPS